MLKPSAEVIDAEASNGRIKLDACEKTGISTIDFLIGCMPIGSVTEFYGDIELLKYISYKVAARLHCRGGAALALVQTDPINYDLYLLNMYARSYGCSAESMLISRSFRIEDSVSMLKEAGNLDVPNIVIYDPYVHAPLDPMKYSKLTPLTGIMRYLASNGKRVILLNRISQFGRYLPEGGKMAHHIAFSILRIERIGSRSYRAELVKHPSKPERSTTGSIDEIYSVDTRWEGQLHLLEWL